MKRVLLVKKYGMTFKLYAIIKEKVEYLMENITTQMTIG